MAGQKVRFHQPRGPQQPRAAKAEASGLERVFGKHSVRAVFLARPKDVRRLIIARDEGYHEDFAALAVEAGLKPEFLDWPDFLRLGGFHKDERHQGIFILAEPRPVYSEKDFDDLEGARMVLALDQISDPQNLATMVRCAAFFGVEAVLLLRDRSADVTPDVVRHAVGGVEFVRIFRVTNLSQSLEALKDFGFFVVGLDERGEKDAGGDALSRAGGAGGRRGRRRPARQDQEILRCPGAHSRRPARGREPQCRCRDGNCAGGAVSRWGRVTAAAASANGLAISATSRTRSD